MSYQVFSHARSVLTYRSIHTANVVLSNQTHYELLGVPVNATRQEIRTAFVILSKKHHPDVSKSKNAHTTFAQINEAYNVLSSPAKRYQYDAELYVMKSSANKTSERHTRPSGSSPFAPKASAFTYARDYQYYDNLSESEWAELYEKSNPKPNHFRVVRWLLALMFVGTVIHSIRINAAHKQFKERSDKANEKNIAAYALVRERAKNTSLQEQFNRLSSKHADEQRKL